jgi:hypothetical protein
MRSRPRDFPRSRDLRRPGACRCSSSHLSHGAGGKADNLAAHHGGCATNFLHNILPGIKVPAADRGVSAPQQASAHPRRGVGHRAGAPKRGRHAVPAIAPASSGLPPTRSAACWSSSSRSPRKPNDSGARLGLVPLAAEASRRRHQTVARNHHRQRSHARATARPPHQAASSHRAFSTKKESIDVHDTPTKRGRRQIIRHFDVDAATSTRTGQSAPAKCCIWLNNS